MSRSRRRREFRGRKIIMISIAVFVFSELEKAFGILQDKHEEKSANLIGMMMIAYTNTILFSE